MKPSKTRLLVEDAFPLIVLLVLFFLAFNTLQPFLPALVWGLILAVAFQPSHDLLVARFGNRRKLASIIVGLMMTFVLVLPMIGLSQAVLAFIPELLAWGNTNKPIIIPVEGGGIAIPGGSQSLWSTILSDITYIRDHFKDEIRPFAFWLIGEARLVGTFVIEFALGVLIASLLLNRSAPLSEAFFGVLGRVAGPLAIELAHHSVVTIRSTVFGLLGSAFVQTALASLAYWYIEAPHWPVLSLLTFMLAMIQIGPILIWLPLAIWLWSNDQIGLAIGLSAWGLIVVGLSDNLVKTLALSRGAELPAILAFLGAVGGLITWGIVGLFLGPVIVAVCYQILLRWIAHKDDITQS
ncbi:AI-2E family transporter [Ovoidimarina sediminis]|uniref:AI-2E family transporter n=1 Tax=Ovoidimarina sediminis TaxID=3079856 RepID=UPI002913D6F8|nr:AI-2E family transporter [Rhodophyticola sp. MJ-SS7]MDU8946577.1 AI-2E family transporter [Rhodophyticola sp. MJ-SS7]